MAEQTITDPLVEVPVQEGQHEENKPSPIEDQALEMGWKPREEFAGTDDEFIDAKEFVRRKPLFDRLEQQSKQLKNVTVALGQLQNHYTKVREVEFQRALSELKVARKQAVSDSDGDRYEIIDDRIKEVEKAADLAKKEASEQAITNAPDPTEFNNWVSKNSWYQKDEAMSAYADKVGLRLKEQVDDGNLTPYQVLQKVEQAVRVEFPHKFRNPNKDNAPNIGESRGVGTRKDADASLSPEEKKIMDSFLRMKNPDGTPFMTKDQYMKDLSKIKGRT